MFRTILIAALAFVSTCASAHEAVVKHHAHAAESRKPHDAIARHPHEASSHAKPQKPPKHPETIRAKAPKVPKH